MLFKNKIFIPFLTLLWLILTIIGIYIIYNDSISNIGFSPTQPIAFSHKSHSSKMGIKCLYCHQTAETSYFSSIPNAYSCMVCHVAFRSDSASFKYITYCYENNLTIQWKRIYYLPDYTHFNHSRHIRAQIDCSSCHGEVEKMDTVYQVAALTMGWCLNCHRNPEKFVIPARLISGINTSYDKNKRIGISELIITNYIKNNLITTFIKEETGIINTTDPAYGLWETTLPKQNIYGFLQPKQIGKGPETCSSCHY